MFSFKPKEDEFFRLFSESARVLYQGALILNAAMNDTSLLEAKIKEINELEQTADDINDAIVDRLNLTFITPLDREDIYLLATKMDDVVDYVQGVIERMYLYKVSAPSAGAMELSRLLIDCSKEMVKAFDLLKNIKGNQQQILDHSRNIVALENAGDHIYRQEVATLLNSGMNPIDIMKWKEILEYQEDALDFCERIADSLRGVVLKYA